MSSQRLLLIATGSSAAIILTAYLSELRAAIDLEIDVLMTTAAERFVRPEVVALFADRVLTCDTPGLNPIEAALTADAMVVLPASGNTISSAALGLMSTPATTALAAAPSPVLYLPHMNGVVWAKPFMRQHVATLRERGDTVIAPSAGVNYEIWRRSTHPALSMPAPDEAAALVAGWLRARTADGAVGAPAATLRAA